MNYQIYRLCRDNERIKKLQREEKKFSLPKTEYVTGVDMYTFINDIILNCKTDYALLCHDDVVLPLTIHENIEKCIESANNYIGQDNWAVIGNAGIEVLTKKVLHYLTDPDIKIIPPYTKHPDLVESVDGNTMLLNIKNLRSKKVLLPKELSGFHLYDIILCLEAQRKGLVCGVSSYLFVTHLSGGNRQAFVESWKNETFQEYFVSNYNNKEISSLNGKIIINGKKNEKNADVEDCFRRNIITLFKHKKIILNIISEKENSHVNELKKKGGKNIKINILSDGNTKELVERINDTENSFSIILREEDTLSENFLKYIQYMTSNSKIIIGNTKVNTSHLEKSTNITDIYTGKRQKPLNLVIYHSKLLKKVIKELNLKNSVYDDYLILFTASKCEDFGIYPILLGSRKDKNKKTSFESYPFTTLLSQIVNKNLVKKTSYDFYKITTEELKEQIFAMSESYHEFLSFQQGFIWKTLEKFRKIKRGVMKKH